MNDAISPPALATVVALRIRDFLRAPVAEQVRLKDQLEAIAETALAPIASDARIVLDASDGLVLVVLAGPGQALEVAERVQTGARTLALLVGVDYGPVRAVDHDRRGSGLVGDGIAAGIALAGATIPGRIATSRSFREVLEWAAPGRAAELVAAGSFTDARTRTHEMYAWEPRARGARRRRFIAAGALGAAGILGLGAAARVLLQERQARPAVLEFNVSPRGDVVVDGVVKGATPPLKRLEVGPGARVIEIRAAGYPSLKLDVNLAPQQTMTIQHTFAKPERVIVPAPAPAAPKRRREPTVIDDVRRGVNDLRRRFGF